MNSAKMTIAIMFFLFATTIGASFAGEKSKTDTLKGMYLNQENPNAPRIEFKENGVFLLYGNEGVAAHGTYEVEEGMNTLLLKLGNGSAVRFEFKKADDLSSFSHPKMGTWKKLDKAFEEDTREH